MAEEKNEKALTETNPNVVEAQALTELSEKVAKLTAENKDLKEAKSKYYDTVLNGGKIAPTVKHRTSVEIRKEWIDTASSNTNLRNAQLSVELDEAIIRETGESSYLPKGHDDKGVPIVPTVEERDRAERMHDVLKECIEEAGSDMSTFTGGDPNEFNLALKRRRL